MRREDPSPRFDEFAAQSIFKETAAYVDVNRAEDVIEYQYPRPGVQSPGKRYAPFLTTAKVDTSTH
ncbi:MAG: hypothetical protein LQ345_005649, partial [Seirophora villosa]